MPEQSEQEAYYRRVYAKMDAEVLLGILKGPSIIDSSCPAALAVFAERGMTEEQLLPYTKPKENSNHRGVASDDALGEAVDLLGDALDDLF